MNAKMQLSEAAITLKDMGVNLKGDLPILMCEDSADVWASRSLFNLKKRAGGPPDQFSELGQNWGFPVYDWDGHREAVLSFWKNRYKRQRRSMLPTGSIMCSVFFEYGASMSVT
jgi:4-alpha-glucanotransferase